MPANEKKTVRVHLEVSEEGTPLSITGAAAATAPAEPVVASAETTVEAETEIDVEA